MQTRRALMSRNRTVPPVSEPKHRHPASDPQQQVRKELTQCQSCFKSKADGATLFKCSGCKVDLYCSKECQKKEWATHKLKCKLNQRTIAADGQDRSALIQKLRQFTSKHRPSFAQAGVQALELANDITRCQRDVLVVYLHSRPGPVRPETAFYITRTEVRAIDSFGFQAAEMRQQLQLQDVVNKRTGAVATLFVMLWCVDQDISNIAPVGVWSSVLDEVRKEWEKELTIAVNQGIVF